ncbi:class I SAM-dependent methyltransferase [Candidatus Woesearchaeota archaeon]|nr:class I SAM-dependent methyltransferase [Candidatus Woesearchaeota archaeon]
MGYYNSTSKGYNELHSEEQRKKVAIIKQNLKIKKSYKLLDVGCGTGLSSDFDCNVYGIDPSTELLKQSKIKNKILGRAEKNPFEGDFFDIVVSVTAIHNFDDAEKGLLEMKRVGKRDFAFSVLKKSKKFNEIKNAIKKNFKIKKTIEEEKDIIFFCGK